jgi:single-stranded-DNA-specific exonuclease
MEFEWVIKKQANLTKIRELSRQLNNLPFSLSNLLIQRDIDSYDKAEKFFRPNLKNLHDPFLMKDMSKAVERLQKAISNNEKILIYGDYDVDGTTSVALVFSFLKKFYNNLDFYIPDRYSEGYGISTNGIDYANENNCKLVIALDCGIKAIEKINYANEKNIDFIICDHHTPGDKIPDAVAVLNPKQKDCRYPYKELSGCGVGFKFMQAFEQKTNNSNSKIFDLLEYVAISIASDIVPITGENRILEYYGLQKLKNTNKAGLIALLEVAGMKKAEQQSADIQDITVSDLVFKIGPRINAAGRMAHAKAAVELLIEQDTNNAREFAKKLNEHNQDRKNTQDEIFKDILKIFDENPDLINKNSTVLFNENWNKGIVGIVASKIIEKYYKPTIILTKSNDKWTGSGRSVQNFDLYTAIDNCRSLLHSFGGHKFAAGLTVTDDNLEHFADCFEKSVSQMITDDNKNPKITISDIINFSDITDKFVRLLKQFAPFGPENMKPVFVTFNVKATDQTRQIGKDYLHLRLEMKDTSGKLMTGIAFGKGYIFDEIKNGQLFDVCYTIGENNFNGKTSLQLDIKDIRLKQ